MCNHIAKTPVTITRLNNTKLVVVTPLHAQSINVIANSDIFVIQTTLLS